MSIRADRLLRYTLYRYSIRYDTHAVFSILNIVIVLYIIILYVALIRAHESVIIQLIRRRVLFWGFFVIALLKIIPRT